MTAPLETAVGMAAAVRAGEVSAVELVTRALERIERLDAELNSCVRVLGDEALAAARREPSGPLAGVPVTVKEIFDVEGEVVTWGCPALRDAPPAVRDDPHVARLRAAGAIVVARTNVPELSCWGHTDNPVYGETRNPHDHTRTPGGSSGGAAASVALGIAPLALGSDAGGSVRIPASFCGVVGLKPSFDTLPADAAAHVSRLNCAGTLTTTVADAALALRTLAGATSPPAFDARSAADPSAPGSAAAATPDFAPGFAGDPPELPGGLRIGFTPDFGFAPVDPAVREGFAATIAALADEGLPLVEAEPPARSPLPFVVPMLACEVYDAFADILRRDDSGLSPQTLAVAGANGTIGGPEYVRCATRRLEFEAAWRAAFEDFDVLLSPTTQITAFELERFGPDAIDGRPIDPETDGAWYPTSFIANVLGAPAIAVPSGRDSGGLPLSVQVMGVCGADGLVLAVAEAVERIVNT